MTAGLLVVAATLLAAPPLQPLVAPAASPLVPSTRPAPGSRHDLIRRARHWGYQLQKVDADALAASRYDVLVIDYAREDASPWTPEEVARLKQRDGRPRIVLAYVSVGEAEDYRPYWQPGWKKTAPAWLGKENPEWKGNYPVRYWDPGWQVHFLGPEGYLDTIVAQGFDGVYLDRIDVYRQWGPAGEGERYEHDNAPAMVRWVEQIARHLRVTRGVSDLLVVGQNAPLLAAQPRYPRLVSAVALEDLFYDDDKRQPLEYTDFILNALKPVVSAGHPIFVVDYMIRPRARRRFEKLARSRGLIPYAAPGRALDRLSPPPAP